MPYLTPGERDRLKFERNMAAIKFIGGIIFIICCLPGMIIGGYIFFLLVKALLYH